MVSIGNLNIDGDINAPFSTPYYDVAEFKEVRSLLFSNYNALVYYRWSNDGTQVDYEDQVSILAATALAKSKTITVKGQFLSIRYVSLLAYPSTFRCFHLFYETSSEPQFLGNIGNGVELYDENTGYIRSLISSDSSISITGSTGVVDFRTVGATGATGEMGATGAIGPTGSAANVSLTSISGASLVSGATGPNLSIKGLTGGSDDIQIKDNGTNLQLDIGQTTSAGANSYILANRTNYLTSGLTGIDNTVLGKGSTPLNLSGFGYNTCLGSDAGRSPTGPQNTAVGYGAGQTNQLGYATSCGYRSGAVNQGAYCSAFGHQAGEFNQANYSFGSSVAIGPSCARSSQGQLSVAIGPNCADNSQGEQCVSVGRFAGSQFQGYLSVALGNAAGRYNQKTGCVAIGSQAANGVFGTSYQNNGGIAIGNSSALYGQGQNAISIGVGSASGSSDGSNLQKDSAIAIGNSTAQINQGIQSIALGYKSAQYNQSDYSISIGSESAQYTQQANSVSIGYLAGKYNQSNCSVAIGCNAAEGLTGPSGATGGQGAESVSVGRYAGQISQATQAVAVGFGAGQTNQSTQAVALGWLAGNINQNSNSIAIGRVAGGDNQKQNSIAIGAQAAQIVQQPNSIAIGPLCGYDNQQTDSIAIGSQCAWNNQKAGSISIGGACNRGIIENVGTPVGYQDVNSVAIGAKCCPYGQGTRSIALGAFALFGNTGATGNQGTDAICIGYNSCSVNGQPNYSIAFGSGCATPGNTGRLAFGNNMEPITSISSSSIQGATGLINLEWNGTQYRIPAFPSTTTDIKTAMMHMAIGELYYSNATGTTTSGINTAGGVSISGTPAVTLETSSHMGNPYFDEPLNGQLRYKGTETHYFHCAFSLSCSVANNNQALSFFLKKNGAVQSKSIYYFTSATGGNNFTVAGHAVITLSTNDYIELWAENTTAANEMTVRNVNLLAMGDGS